MTITWLGHSAVKIEGSRTVFIDPFLSGNPRAALTVDQVDKADAVIITHDHNDHLGDGFEICRRTGATLFAIYEIAQAASDAGLRSESMNVGGTVTSAGVTVSLVPALHSGGRGGTAVGAVIELDNHCVYHAGDTGLTMEMQWIGEVYHPQVAFLPIDGRFNMTPQLAARAVAWLKVARVVPIHYDTFPAIRSSPQEFQRLVGDRAQVIVLKPGESLRL